MGKEWLYKGGGGGGGAGKPSSTGKSRERNTSSSSSSSSSGCMSAIFHLFDIQHHQNFNIHQPSNFISDSLLKGVEAPRNSLELEEPMMDVSSSSSSSKIKEDTNLNISMGGIQIKTKRSMEDLSSECSSSPSAKTPNLVARLMGLDLLPDNSSPRPSSSSTPLNPISNLTSHHLSRSLPTTPRISTASRRSTDADYHHRLSLQINKENSNDNNSTCQMHESTSQHAKQIAKQVIRENISRRVGADITNTVSRRDQNLVLLKPKRSSPPPHLPPPATGKQDGAPPLSYSPKLRLLEIKNNLKKPISDSPKSSQLSSSKSKPKSPPHQVQLMKQEVQLVKQENDGKVKKKCKRIASERYDLRLKKVQQQQQEEQFVNIFENKCKKKSTPLSNHLLKSKTKFTCMKKDMTSSPSTATLPQKQVSFESITVPSPSGKRRSYNTKELSLLDNVSAPADNCSNGVATTPTATGGPLSGHSDYISKILHHSGIYETTPISVAHWYSPSHPLHPSIFHQLEKLFHPTVADAASRKLVFDLVDELLVEILKPYINLKPWVGSIRRDGRRMLGRELIGKLCQKMGSFPAADCRVLEDIDCLIDGDLRSGTTVVGSIAVEEEAEEVATEIVRDIVDTLLHEIIWIG